MRRLLTAALGLGLLALAGCSGDADPAPAPASPSSTTASPSPSPSPTAPVMPEAARAHTEAGAKAFVEYFWEVVNYAQATGDTDAIRTLSVKGCAGCDAGMRAIDRIYDGGGRILGGNSTLSRMECALAKAADELLATVNVDVTNAPETDDFPGETRDTTRTSTTVRDRLLIRAVDAGWQVAQIEVLK